MIFENRVDAGRQLAKKLGKTIGKQRRGSVVVVALPRGGVVVGAEVAKALGAPLGIVTPRKIGHPQNQEFAMAAVSGSGLIVWNQPMLEGLNAQWYCTAIQGAMRESNRRRKKYLSQRRPISLHGKTVIVVDDGMATGLTMLAAVAEIRGRDSTRIIVAIPVAPRETIKLVKPYVESVITISIPRDFTTVGTYYKKFDDISDQEVKSLVKNSQLPNRNQQLA